MVFFGAVEHFYVKVQLTMLEWQASECMKCNVTETTNVSETTELLKDEVDSMKCHTFGVHNQTSCKLLQHGERRF